MLAHLWDTQEEVAKEFGIPVQFQRFWLWAKRQNHTYRPNRPLTHMEEAQSVNSRACLKLLYIIFLIYSPLSFISIACLPHTCWMLNLFYASFLNQPVNFIIVLSGCLFYIQFCGLAQQFIPCVGFAFIYFMPAIVC